jgi:predicted ATP-dependent endonuclease of OLD family
MRLVNLELVRYRSIRDQSESDSISFEGLDCLVGKNNAGKTNILSAIKFLLDEREKSLNKELFWKKDCDQTVEVKGFFEVTEEDLKRIENKEKREAIQDSLLNNKGYDDILGVCKTANKDGGISTETQLLQFLPDDDHYSKENFEETHGELWNSQREKQSFTKTDYRNRMKKEFPEVAERVPEEKMKNKGIWETKYGEYVDSWPDNLEFSLQPDDFRDGVESIIFNQFLPHVISIPAIKEVESTTKRGGEFGNLVDQISAEVQDELDNELEDRLEGFNPQGHKSIQRVQQQISDHLGATFEDQSVKFEFPTLSTEYLFRNADIHIQENTLDSLSKENVGEGVKRTLIFSLVRTLSDIREGRFQISDEDDQETSSRPLLILYEEAELFLHPSLQKTLLQTFDQLTTTNTQTIFSTHSPVLIQHKTLDTINIVRRQRGETEVTQFDSVLREETEAEQSRLTNLQSVSSYIFADKVVLVEGLSDRLVLKKMARRLNPEWDFEKRSIPLLEVGGKGHVCRFFRFLNKLGIETFVVFDVDAAKGQCQTIIDSQTSLDKLEVLEERVNDEFDGAEYNINELSNGMQFLPWDDAFERVGDLKERIREGTEVTDEDAELLEKILGKCEQTEAPNSVWTSDKIEQERIEVVEDLLEQNILLLSGDIEDYYPYDGGNKREAALEFEPDEYELPQLREPLPKIDHPKNTDLEAFFDIVFMNDQTGLK